MKQNISLCPIFFLNQVKASTEWKLQFQNKIDILNQNNNVWEVKLINYCFNAKSLTRMLATKNELKGLILVSDQAQTHWAAGFINKPVIRRKSETAG